jgi:uncharacterized protein YqjF (DUF2071 family)
MILRVIAVEQIQGPLIGARAKRGGAVALDGGKTRRRHSAFPFFRRLPTWIVVHCSRPEPGSLEFFLVERYRLYSSAPDGLRRGAVFHEPYPLCRAEVTAWDEHLLPLDGFTPTGRAPDHVIMSRGVDVTIFPLERVKSG